MNRELLLQHYERHRPFIHYSCNEGWMNDPNGLIFFDGYYHLFYQHDPESVVQDKMHWGHARTRDFIVWEELPIALYPDELGTIFSGCMVYDKNNTSGLGKNGKAPLVAVFTHNYEKNGEKIQYQSLAFSLDEGMTFHKYEGNPVLDLRLADFRDPKVIWDSGKEKWIMLVSGGTEILFFESGNLRIWSRLSSFSVKGAVSDIIWECPDLQELETENGEKKWVLFVSENTLDYEKTGVRYFPGNFDGVGFTAESGEDRALFLDFGRDNYAAAVYQCVKGRIIQQSWMNCWTYAGRLPESGFRGSMTFPREISLRKTQEGYKIIQKPVNEWQKELELKEMNISGKEKGLSAHGEYIFQASDIPGIYKFVFDKDCRGEILLSNEEIEIKISIDYSFGKIIVDRSKGADLHYDLGPYFREACSVYFQNRENRNVYVILDVTSIELFAAGGEAAGTFQYFTKEPLHKMSWRN